MGTSKSPLIVIPARIGSTRLKDKPLRLINGVPLVTHVCRRALEADIGHVVLSTDDTRVLEYSPPGTATWFLDSIPNEHCGSDRVAYTAAFYGDDFDYIINLQGDLPFIDPQILRDLWRYRALSGADIVTAAAQFDYVQIHKGLSEFRLEPGPPVIEFDRRVARAFHIGLYAFTSASLKRFAALPPSKGELEHKLEQKRATEAGMSFQVVGFDQWPLEINTESDLYHANLIAGFCRVEDTGASTGGLESHPGPDDGGV